MANLGAAHKGYLYQDIATAYFLATSLVDPVREISVDYKRHAADRFDDLSIVETNATQLRRQFKHTDGATPFAQKFLSSDTRGLRLDALIQSWRKDSPAVRAAEYRVCTTWTVPTDADDLALLVPAEVAGSFGEYPTRRFRLAVDQIWPKRQKPWFPCLRSTSRAELVAFARNLRPRVRISWARVLVSDNFRMNTGRRWWLPKSSS